MQINNKHKTLFVLFWVRLLSSIAFAVLFSSLALYLVNDVNYSPGIAADLVGTFIAFNYFLPVIGGYIGDRFIDFKKLFILGHLGRGLGCFLLVYALHYPYLGLSFFLIGSLGSSVSINMFITKLFSKEDIAVRKIAFYWNYAGMNLGFLLGYTIAGKLGLNDGYIYLFWFVSIISILTAILAYFVIKLDCQKRGFNKFSTGIFIIILLVIVLRWILKHIIFTHFLLLTLSLGALVAVLILILHPKYKEDRKKLSLFFILMLVSVFFWTIYMLVPVSLLLFIQKNVVTTVNGIKIAPQWLENIDPIIIIIGSLFLASIIKRLKDKWEIFKYSTTFFAIGLFFVSLGATLLAYGSMRDSAIHQLSLIWIVIFIASLSFGDLFIGPIGYSLVGELVPDSLRGLFMGAWIMTLGISSVISSFFANSFLVPIINNYSTLSAKQSFTNIFIWIATITFFIAALLIALIPFVRNITEK